MQDPLMAMLREWRGGLCGCRVVSSGIHNPHCAAGNVSDIDLEELANRIDDYTDDIIDDAVEEELKERSKGQHHETSPGQTSDTSDASAGLHRESEASPGSAGGTTEVHAAVNGEGREVAGS
jgi:hypothetical protein